jgi:hypothetical protein
MKKETQSPQELYQQLRTLIDLSSTVVKASQLIPDDQKRMYLTSYENDFQEAKTFAEQNNSNFLRQLIKEVLTPWDETTDADSQHFWKLVQEHGLPVKQTDYLGKILSRGRIATMTEYDLVQDSLVIWQQEGRITGPQTAQLEEMLNQYERKHHIT